MKIFKSKKSISRKIALVFIGLCLAFSSLAKKLVITKHGNVKYIINSNQMLHVHVNNRNIKGVATVLNDSTIKINDKEIQISSISAVKIKDANTAVKNVGYVGLITGTGLIAGGAAMMNQEGIEGIFQAIAGLAVAVVGAAVGVISTAALIFSEGKWITFSKRSKHKLVVL